ncbi:MAG: hypothetical protein PVI23_09695 [Maricaulaceae bacterium]|jgi:hypothetical protein
MMRSTDHAQTFARFNALDAALRETARACRPEYARRFAALALLGVQDEPRSLAQRTSNIAEDLVGAPGIASAARPVFAASLVIAGRSVDDYLRTREALSPVLRGGLRKGLPSAALIYAAAGRSQIDDAMRARIEGIAPLVRAPWWCAAAARNGFFAAALALDGDRLDVIEARVEAARRALDSAGASTGLARDGGRELALTGAEPVSAALTWSKLRALRGAHQWRGLKPASLIGPAAAVGADADAAARALDDAYDAVHSLRPRVSSVARPFLAAGLARFLLSPTAAPGDSAVSAVQGALAIIAANEAAMAAVIASGAAVVAAT